MDKKRDKCPHRQECAFRRAFHYCIKQIGEECDFFPPRQGEDVEENGAKDPRGESEDREGSGAGR